MSGTISSDSWLDAQYSVLGSVLIDGRCAAQLISETSESDYSGTCRTIYRAMKKIFLAGQEVDPVVVSNAAGAGYRDFILQLMDITPTAANVGLYIRICKEQARVLALREIGTRLAEAETLDDAKKLLDEANGSVMDRQNSRAKSLESLLSEFFRNLSTPPDFLPWPVAEIRDHVRISPGDLVILGGDPSAGKTAWALQLATFWAKSKRICYFSLETQDQTLLNRLVSTWSQVDKSAILERKLSAEQYRLLTEAGQNLVDARIAQNMDIVNASGFSVADIRARTMMGRYDIIVVDYMQLVQAEGQSAVEQISSISAGLHTMAQTMGVTVLAISQLNRDSTGTKTDMSRMKGSGQIEYDADVIMMLKLEKPKDYGGTRILTFAKNKEGQRFDIPLAFDGKTQRFTRGVRAADAAVKKYAQEVYEQRRENQRLEKNRKNSRIPAMPEPEDEPEPYAQLPIGTSVPW